MGLERIAAVMQGVHSNYDIDLFKRSDPRGGRAGRHHAMLASNSLRVIADHIRACTFLIVDGVLPSNEGRGYVLRRIIRRAIRHGYKLGIQEPFFYKLVPVLVEEMGEAYPELARGRAQVERVLKQEEERFAETLANGMVLLEARHPRTARRQGDRRRHGVQAVRHLRLPAGPDRRHRARARARRSTRPASSAAMEEQRDALAAGQQVRCRPARAARRSTRAPCSRATSA